MRILIAIPCLFGAEHTKLSIESVINHDLDLLLIDNGAAHDVKAVIAHYEKMPNVFVLHNEVNVYVNPAWNQAMQYFQDQYKSWSHLILMNSDLIMREGWYNELTTRLSVYPNTSLVPNMGEANDSITALLEGIAGVFIVLSEKQVDIVHPIPSSIRVWFGDNWIYNLIRGFGYGAVVSGRLCADHYRNGSQNVSKVHGISEIIEQDKIAWVNEVEPAIKERINLTRGNT